MKSRTVHKYHVQIVLITIDLHWSQNVFCQTATTLFYITCYPGHFTLLSYFVTIVFNFKVKHLIWISQQWKTSANLQPLSKVTSFLFHKGVRLSMYVCMFFIFFIVAGM